MGKPGCKCLICETGRDLTLSLESPTRKEVFRSLARDFPVLAEFPSVRDLIYHLHRRDLDTNQVKSADRILGFLIRGYASGSAVPILPEVLVLVFTPTLHRTYREICDSFQNLSREDVAQQVMAALFEVTRFPAIQNLNNHISVTLARTLRTTVRRWAMKQSRELSDSEPIENLDLDAPELTAEGNFEDALILHDLLNRCYADGSVSMENYELFLKLKLDGFAAKEVAGSTGELSPKAVHRRIERTIRLLRRQASL